jgi:beta-propeller uncharacterized protein DUF5122
MTSSVAAVTIAAGATAQAASTAHATVVSADPANTTPHMLDGTVYKFGAIGNRIYAGGSYTQVRNANSQTVLDRRFLIAFNKDTGLIDTGFNPTFDAAVHGLVAAPDGQSLYVGGDFRNVNGVRSRGVVRLDAATGAIWPGWSPANIGGQVGDLKLLGGRLLVGGSFLGVNGTTRPGLVALNAETGAAGAFLNGITLSEARVTQTGATGPLKVTEMDVTPDGTKLVIIGNFNQVAGLPRPQVAVVDLTTDPATLHSWATERFRQNCAPGFPSWIRGVSISPDGTYMGIATTGGPNSPTALCDSLSRWELTGTGGNQRPTWVNHTGGDTLYSVAVTGAAVYTGGHQRWMNNDLGRNFAGPGAVPREGIAAVDPVTGKALPWNPGKTRGVGTQDIFATPEGLWIGSDGSKVAGEFHGKIAFFPL